MTSKEMFDSRITDIFEIVDDFLEWINDIINLSDDIVPCKKELEKS